MGWNKPCLSFKLFRYQTLTQPGKATQWAVCWVRDYWPPARGGMRGLEVYHVLQHPQQVPCDYWH